MPFVREAAAKLTDRTFLRRRIQARVNYPIQKRLYPPTKAVPAADWDTLIVMDACPDSLFETVGDPQRWDTYGTERSGAGNTYNWLREHWTDQYPDTVYIAGNPMVSRHTPGQFYELKEPWREAVGEDDTVPRAAPVTEAALAAHDTYPQKRIVVHYMQPHYPFIGHPELQFTTFEGTGEWDAAGDSRASDVWEALRKGLVTEAAVRSAYRDNLEYVLDHVRRLADAVDGRLVLTSDHGNLFGARTYPIPIKEYGHSCGLPQPTLATVPWCVSDGPRREIVAEEGTSMSAATTEEMTSHLRALGYAE